MFVAIRRQAHELRDYFVTVNVRSDTPEAPEVTCTVIVVLLLALPFFRIVNVAVLWFGGVALPFIVSVEPDVTE